MFFKSARCVCYLQHFNLPKTALKKAYFLQKLIFCIFESKYREAIENSSKAHLAFDHWNAHFWTKIVSESTALSQNEIEKLPLITSVQCTSRKSHKPLPNTFSLGITLIYCVLVFKNAVTLLPGESLCASVCIQILWNYWVNWSQIPCDTTME